MFFSIIIGPITEEVMMRIILKEHFSKISYILLSGLLFGLLHVVFSLSNNLLELLYIIPYGALGCALASIYYKTDNIWTNITFHALHNTICILILLIGALL